MCVGPLRGDFAGARQVAMSILAILFLFIMFYHRRQPHQERISESLLTWVAFSCEEGALGCCLVNSFGIYFKNLFN